MSTRKHTEETLFGALLTMAAGSIDAHSYLMHGQVFAGLQTGNLILLGVRLGEGQIAQSYRYLISIAAFVCGTILIRIIQREHRLGEHEPLRRRIILGYEAIMLLIIAAIGGFLPDTADIALLSFTAAAELQEFRRLEGAPFTPLMMTGNLRSLSESAYDAIVYHERTAWRRLRVMAGILAGFASGALLMSIITPYLHYAGLIMPAAIILVSMSFAFRDHDPDVMH